MTEVTAYPDSGAVQASDYLWLARGSLGYKLQASRLHYDGKGTASSLSYSLSVNMPVSGAGGWYIAGVFSAPTNTMVRLGATNTDKWGSIGSPGDGSVRFIVNGTAGTSGQYGMSVLPDGSVGIGTTATRGRVTILNGQAPTTPQTVNALTLGEQTNAAGYLMSMGMFYSGSWAGAIDVVAAGAAAPLYLNPSSGNVILGGGNLLVGVPSGSFHTIASGAAQGTTTMRVQGSAAVIASFVGVGGYSPNAAGSALYLGYNTSTSRSLNASGTINASGADYAEYMTKAPGCETIAPGDVCGVDASGQLVTAWTSAIHYRVKSTKPNLVGGDVWGSEAIIGARPEEPIFSPPAYDGPPAPAAPSAFDEPAPVPTAVPNVPVFDAVAPDQPARGGEDDVQWAMIVNAFVIADMRFQQAHADFEAALASHEALAAQIAQANAAAQADYEARVAAHAAAVAAYATAKAEYDQAQADHATAIADAEAAHTAALTAYQAELADWEARLEAERVKVDRIAYCGQVPVNFSGEFAAGDYLVAVQDGDGIGLESVTPAAMIADLAAGGGLYLRRVGRVLRALDDGRPLIDVQHG